jgi:hypothetical protein
MEVQTQPLVPEAWCLAVVLVVACRAVVVVLAVAVLVRRCCRQPLPEEQ